MIKQFSRIARRALRFTILTGALGGTLSAIAQANLPVYTDNLVNGFQNWSWATVNFANTSPVHSGTHSVSVINNTNYQAAWFEYPNFDTTPYASVSFWINGGASGGQSVSAQGVLGGNGQGGHTFGPLVANTWQQFTFPLATLGISNKANCNGLQIQGNSLTPQPVFYVDDVQFNAAAAPSLVHLNADASQTIRTADLRWAGINTATWDSSGLDVPSTLSALNEMGIHSLRWPGGSTSDTYHYTADVGGNSRFMNIATNLGASVFVTVNYGSGSSNEAAAWVNFANNQNGCHFKYWEVGNECYGTWENDTNKPANDPYTYAVRAAGYIALMKAQDPTIKIGVVAAPGEDNFVNNTNHPVVNPRTAQTHYGWTPVMLTTLKNLGVTPDFLVDHVYPEYTPPPPPSPPPANDSDALVMQSSTVWANDAADLRQQIKDYFGTGGTNIELVSTENNSDSGAFGRQLTSIVNGLYLADNACQLMKTEFNAYTWWDLRNGQSSSGSFDPTVYGWRSYGDEGVLSGSTRYPTFYAEKLLQYFIRSGDTVLGAGSDYLLLSAYSARRANGALTLLVINKDVTTSLNAQISLANFAPSPVATVRSFGIQQDEATRTNNLTPGSQDIATNSAFVSSVFTNTFPPATVTLFTLTPAAPQLLALAASPAEFDFQLQGQAGAPYVIQSSPDLLNWTSVSTNVLIGSTLNLTYPVSPGSAQEFWRAVWQP